MYLLIWSFYLSSNRSTYIKFISNIHIEYVNQIIPPITIFKIPIKRICFMNNYECLLQGWLWPDANMYKNQLSKMHHTCIKLYPLKLHASTWAKIFFSWEENVLRKLKTVEESNNNCMCDRLLILKYLSRDWCSKGYFWMLTPLCFIIYMDLYCLQSFVNYPILHNYIHFQKFHEQATLIF
jgi:hypothetical protein